MRDRDYLYQYLAALVTVEMKTIQVEMKNHLRMEMKTIQVEETEMKEKVEMERMEMNKAEMKADHNDNYKFLNLSKWKK
jgi:hypothetical protein